MRKHFFPFLIILTVVITVVSLASSLAVGNRPRGQLAVRGVAELEVEANKITVSFTLSDYFIEELTSHDAATFRTRGPTIIEIEAEALAVLATAGFTDVRLDNARINRRWFSLPNNSSLSHSYNVRSYSIVVSDFAAADRLLQVNLPFNTTQFAITGLENTHIEEYRLQVMQAALANARSRAEALAAGYGRVRGLLFVSDGQSRITAPQAGINARTALAAPMMEADSAEFAVNQNLNLRTIKLSAGVDAIFILN
ncbi:MAG: SIMPL domain-containing protein [Spirochaetaceae bacterium]|nr:SIMPL domain-containing protein [Spirochaetaceae bacterium]